MRTLARRFAFRLSLATSTAAFVCSAQSSDSNKAMAVSLFDEATALMDQGAFAQACLKFANSNRLDPQLGVLLHLANCYEKDGQLASAWASWRDAAELAQARGDARLKVAKDRASALAAKLSKLVIEVPEDSAVEGLQIRADGALVDPALWGTPVPVNAGERVLQLSAPGKLARTVRVTVAGNAAVTTYRVEPLDDDPAQTAAGGVGASPSAADPYGSPRADSGTDPGATQRTLGWVTGGLGVVGLGFGLVFELQRSSKVSDRAAICPTGKGCSADEDARVNALNDEVSQAATLETIAFTAGGALLVGGVVLLLTAPSPRAAAAQLQFAPSVSPHSAGLTAIGRW